MKYQRQNSIRIFLLKNWKFAMCVTLGSLIAKLILNHEITILNIATSLIATALVLVVIYFLSLPISKTNHNRN